MGEKNLKPNLDFVEKNIGKLFKQYPYKYLIIYDQRVVNSFDTYETAAEEAVNLLGEDADFLIYQIVKDKPINFVLAADL